jgi:Protein of unknown function (DUF4197)
MKKSGLVLLLSLLLSAASAADLSGFTKTDATTALRTALTQGATKAVASLGQTDGFFKNPEVKIPLPPALSKAAKTMRRFGLGDQADQLELTMNRAAEAAVPEAKTLVVGAVKSMSVEDAKGILTGGDDAATQYFRRKTQDAIAAKFKPIVAAQTQKVGVTRNYNALAGKAVEFGLLDSKEANLDDYVTQQALDGLYKMIAQEELAIRKDPLGQSSKLLQKVFGAL